MSGVVDSSESDTRLVFSLQRVPGGVQLGAVVVSVGEEPCSSRYLGLMN